VSVIQISNVLRHSASKGTARLVLIALADVANDDGEVTAYARGRKVLAAKANCDEGSVKRAIAKLAKDGELEVLRVGTGREASNYRILVGSIEGGQDAPPAGAGRAPTGGETRALGGQDDPPISPSPSVDGPSSPSPKAEEDLDFELFYEQIYPRRVGRGAARKAYTAARKKADADTILAGAQVYAAAMKGKEARYIAHPATWLNGERWADDPAALAGGNGRNGASSGTGVSRSIDTDRDGEAGELEL